MKHVTRSVRKHEAATSPQYVVSVLISTHKCVSLTCLFVILPGVVGAGTPLGLAASAADVDRVVRDSAADVARAY